MCINGGAGGIGQPLTMLMSMNPLVKEVGTRAVDGFIAWQVVRCYTVVDSCRSQIHVSGGSVCGCWPS